jgi:hypothetical protein
MKGFTTKWISWIKYFVRGESVAVNVNEEDVGHFFQTRKGIRHGDPLSLAILIKRAK